MLQLSDIMPIVHAYLLSYKLVEKIVA